MFTKFTGKCQSYYSRVSIRLVEDYLNDQKIKENEGKYVDWGSVLTIVVVMNNSRKSFRNYGSFGNLL